MTLFSTIYANVLPKFKSYEIPQMEVDEIEEHLHDYLSPAASRFHVCRQNLTDVDEENKCFNADLTNIEIEILSNFLVIEYIDSNYIRVPSILKSTLSSTDFHSYSNANLLEKLMAMHDTFLNENEGLLSKYSWLGLCNDAADNDSINKIKQRSNLKS